MSAKCPNCGTMLSPEQKSCPQCRRRETTRRTRVGGFQQIVPTEGPTTMRRNRESRLNLPRRIEDGRYCFGSTWTSGSLYLIAEGIYFLSDKDGFTTDEAFQKLPPPQGEDFIKIGTLSFFSPEKKIEKIYHANAINAFMMITGKKVPVRLLPGGWDLIDLYAAMLGIKLE